MLSSLIKTEFVHYPLIWPNAMSYRPASTSPSPTSRSPCAWNLLTCFWRREPQQALWNCSISCGFRSQSCGIAFASPLPLPVFLLLDSRKANLRTTRTAVYLCMELIFQPALASSTSFSFDPTCPVLATKVHFQLTAFTDSVHSETWIFII